MRRIAKGTIEAIFWLVALPLALGYTAMAAVCGRQRAFSGWSQALALVPGQCGVWLRRAFYRFTLARCGRDACVSFGSVISHPGASLGQSAYVGNYCCLGNVTLEDDCLLASFVSVTNGGKQHGIERLDVPIREQPGEWPRITIGADSWIGERAVVMADVGRHCVVGAGAVVVQPIPDYAVAVGMPAKVLRYRNAEQPPEETS